MFDEWDDERGESDEVVRPFDPRTFRVSIEEAPEAVYIMTREGGFNYVNRQACHSLGYTREEFLDLTITDIDPRYPVEQWVKDWDAFPRPPTTIETTHRRKDGTDLPVEVTAKRIKLGDAEYHVAFVRDISRRREVEMQLLQAQRLESVGRLAGGVAHDFNNMLSVILGYTELIKEQLTPDDPIYGDLLEIEKAAGRSKDITRQLLAFSRKQVIAPQTVDLNELIVETDKTLVRLIGEDIELEIALGDGLWPIDFDPAQLDQVLVNLAVNARDAMPRGGKLHVATSNARIDRVEAERHGVPQGSYVVLTVTDTGVGMDDETLSHAFEPFFTTKSRGKGTGLGLATVYGIVEQNHGFLTVTSTPGRGTSFRIHLPKSPTGSRVGAGPSSTERREGNAAVLLVEDDDMVRYMTQRMLERLGYEVVSAGSPRKAIDLVEGASVAVDILVTDVVMPDMSGPQLRDHILALRPGVKVLFTSGYTENVVVHHGILKDNINFLAKPYALHELAEAVEQALGEA